MVRAGKSFTIFYPKKEHITCVAYALHRVSERVRLQIPQIDKLITYVN